MSALQRITIFVLLSFGCLCDLRIEYSNNNEDYIINVNNEDWLFSSPSQFRNNGKLANSKINSTFTKNGTDSFLGKYTEFIIQCIDINNKTISFETSFKQYQVNKNVIIFTQTFPTDITDTSTDPNSVISAFPSFYINTQNTNKTKLGYLHFGGGRADKNLNDGHGKGSVAVLPQYGQWDYEHSESLKGGIENNGPLVIYNFNLTNCIVISPLTYAMAENDECVNNKDQQFKIFRYGLMGNIHQIDKGFKISFIMSLTPNGGGINAAMRYWGDMYLKYHNKTRSAHSSLRDYTLQYVGYGTSGGAYYHFYTEPGKNYAQTVLDIKDSHNKIGFPSKWFQLDQWYYNKTWIDDSHDCWYNGHCYDYNLTANDTMFPDGIMPIYKQTGWFWLLQSDPFSYDNVYCNDYGFPCSYNKSSHCAYDNVSQSCWYAIPTSPKFYDYLFSITNKEKYGVVVFEPDAMNVYTLHMDIQTNNTESGRNYMLWMGQGAEKYDVAIQLSMAYPRHLLSTVLSPSFTQSRSTTDYWPGAQNWKIGTISIFLSAMDLAPSKNTWWSDPRNHTGGNMGKCVSNADQPLGCHEPYNRLQSAVVALSNAANYPGDAIGFENVSLIMMCCNSDGLILRPDISATALDVTILGK
eukprot:252505_1